MARIHQDDGRVIPVTVIDCTPNTVVQVKTQEKEGYPALVLGFDEHKKPTKNKKFYFIREITPFAEEKKIGDKINADVLKEGQEVDVTGVTKGKGMQGVMRRWGFHGAPASHGHIRHRSTVSVGAGANPARIWPGKKMPGVMGTDQQTIKARPIIKVDSTKNLIAVKGSVPGQCGTYIKLSW